MEYNHEDLKNELENIIGEDAYNYGAFQADDNKMRFGYTPEELQNMISKIIKLLTDHEKQIPCCGNSKQEKIEYANKLIGEDEANYEYAQDSFISERNKIRAELRAKNKGDL